MSKEDLADLIRLSLRSADCLGETVAAAHLDAALVHLTGSGQVPFDFIQGFSLDHTGPPS
jgi:hypothetical protein